MQLTGHAAGPGHGSMQSLCISRLHSDPLQAVSFALECNFGRFFLLALFWSTSPVYIHENAFTCRNLKRRHFETAIKVNAQVVCITKPSPVAAPFVCSSLPGFLFSSAFCRQTMKIFSVFHSPGLQLCEGKRNIHLRAGENPMALFLLPVVQSHAEHVHSLCRIATFKMLLQHLTCFFVDILFSLLFHLNIKVLWDPGILLRALPLWKRFKLTARLSSCFQTCKLSTGGLL